MNILLTNDDGIGAQGIRTLQEVLSRRHDVYLVAPDIEQSACSNAVTLRTPMTLHRHDARTFSLSGYPADCVNVGLHASFLPFIDLVVSGINHGPNCGDDLYFSGTVGGARTGYVFGKSAIAVSLDSYHRPSPHFLDAAEFVAGFIDEIAEDLAHRPLFFNINHPDLPARDVKGVRYTFVGKRVYNDIFELSEGNPGTVRMQSHGPIGSFEEAGADATELTRGYISVTPLLLDCTDRSYLLTKQGS